MRAVFLDYATLAPADLDSSSLTGLLPDLTFYPDTRAAEIPERLRDAEIVLLNKVMLHEAAIAGAPRLKLICLAATGTDNVALEPAQSRGIGVCNIRDYCTASVTQHVFALILTLNQHLREYAELAASGAWAQAKTFCLLDHPFAEMAGRTLGIIGLGNLGRSVTRVAQAFGMEVLAARQPYRAPVSDRGRPTEDGMQRVSFGELLARSHVVSLHCPLTEETRHLMDGAALARMRRDALLINTARGALVEPQALVRALQEGAIAGAGIDVLDREPPVHGHPLLAAQLPNLIVTPHMAWAAREARQRALTEMAENIADFLRGGRRNRVV